MGGWFRSIKGKKREREEVMAVQGFDTDEPDGMVAVGVRYRGGRDERVVGCGVPMGAGRDADGAPRPTAGPLEREVRVAAPRTTTRRRGLYATTTLASPRGPAPAPSRHVAVGGRPCVRPHRVPKGREGRSSQGPGWAAYTRRLAGNTRLPSPPPPPLRRAREGGPTGTKIETAGALAGGVVAGIGDFGLRRPLRLSAPVRCAACGSMRGNGAPMRERVGPSTPMGVRNRAAGASRQPAPPPPFPALSTPHPLLPRGHQ